MEFEKNSGEPVEVFVSDRDMAHHIRYLGTTGFKNPDGSSRVPTEQEVVDHGWEPESYLTSPIPSEPRHGLCAVGKTNLLAKLMESENLVPELRAEESEEQTKQPK